MRLLVRHLKEKNHDVQLGYWDERSFIINKGCIVNQHVQFATRDLGNSCSCFLLWETETFSCVAPQQLRIKTNLESREIRDISFKCVDVFSLFDKLLKLWHSWKVANKRKDSVFRLRAELVNEFKLYRWRLISEKVLKIYHLPRYHDLP